MNTFYSGKTGEIMTNMQGQNMLKEQNKDDNKNHKDKGINTMRNP